MKTSDHDLEQMYKDHQGYSVATACRAIYDAGVEYGRRELSDEISTDLAPDRKEPITEADAAADLAGTPRPDHPTIPAHPVALGTDSEGGEPS